MPELPSVSIRKYIRRGNGPPKENTSTLVLTSAGKVYVDVRVLKPLHGPLTELNWAFAGASMTTPPEHSASGELTKPMHTKWAHWIDSETEDEVNDEGDMFLQPDGTVLEKGANDDGSTYEELWEELDAQVTGNDKSRVSCVLQVEDLETKTKGMCIRIGEWIQGTLRVGREFTVVRWQWSAQEAEWKEILTIGSGIIPCSSLFDGFDHDGKPILDVGRTVYADDQMRWICKEAFTW